MAPSGIARNGLLSGRGSLLFPSGHYNPAPCATKTFPVYLSNLFSLLPLSSYPALPLDSLLGMLWFLWTLWLACGSF
jgi:hypothetical protein